LLKNRKSRLVVGIVLFLIIVLVVPNAIPTARGEVTKLYPTDDSWVEAETPNNNHGTETEIHVKADTKTRRTYLKFDLSGLPLGWVITSAKLYLYCTAANPTSNLRVDAHETGDSWSEGTITWNNAPAVGALAASNLAVGNIGQFYFWNVTSYAQAQYNGDKKLSVVVKFPLDDPTQNNPDYHRDFASKEYTGTGNDPYLEIVYASYSPPQASFNYSPPDPYAYETITFNASASNDPDGTIVSYRWDFGDSNITTVTDRIITHFYADCGNFTVTLTVTDNDGLTDSRAANVTVLNPALHVSLLDGSIIGSNQYDPWLNEGWLLNLTGTSGTFTVRVNMTSAAHYSYDTHLVIDLNDAGYSNLVSLRVNSTLVPKSAFQCGTPKPYGVQDWSDCVYPTWFNDTCINLGTIPPKGYVDAVVSVSFSNAANVRMHFDAYGKTVCWTPTTMGAIAWSPHSEDSTVLFYPPPVVPPYADFTWSPLSPQVGELVTFNGSLSTPDGGTIVSWDWDFGDTITGSGEIVTHAYSTYGTFTVTLNVTDSECKWDTESKTITVREHPHADFSWSPVSPEVGETVTFNGSLSTPDGGTIISYEWDFGDGSPHKFGKIVTHVYNNNGTYTVTLNVTDSEGKWDTESKSITIRIKKYYLTVVSPYGTTGGQGWYDNCTTAYATLDTGIVDHGNGTRKIFTHWSGDASGTNYSKSNPIHMDGNKTAIANWKTQYRVTFAQTGLDSTATGTVVTVNTTMITFPQLPFTMWVNKSSWVTYFYSDIVSSTVSGKRFKLVNVTSPPSPFQVTGPVTVTGNYKTQYQITVTASPSGALGGTFKVTYTQCGTTYTNIQKTTPWTEWVDASTDVTVSEPQDIISVTPNTRYKFNSYNPSASVHMDQAKTITLVYKIQYLLVVRTDPLGLTPPTRNPAGEAGPPHSWWYDNSTNVLLTAQPVIGYTFLYWNVSGKSQGNGVNPITVHMNQTYTAIAHYAAPRKCVVDFTETPTSPIYNGTKVTFTVQVLQKAFNGTHEINCTLYEWNLTDPNGVPHILRFGKQWNNFSNTMQWTFNKNGNWTVTLRAWCNDAKLISLGMAWSDPVSHTKKVIPRPPAVGGYIAPIDKLSLAPLMEFAMALVATVALTTSLIRHKGRKSAKV